MLLTGQAFDEINLKRWSMSGNTKCPVSGQELRMHRDKLQYTKHHLLRNIIRQQAAKAKVRSVSLLCQFGSASGPYLFRGS